MNQFHFLLKFFTTILFVQLTSTIKVQASIQEGSPGDKKITIIAKDLAVSEIFKNITRQTGLRFSYNNRDVNQNEKITAPFVDMSIDKVLKHIFAGRPLSWVYIDNIVRIGKNSRDQDPSIILERSSGTTNNDTIPFINVTGQVVDASGKPVAGASVSLRGLNKGKSTDNAGYFSFPNIPSNATLVFSSIGFETKQYKLAGAKEILVSLDSLVREIQAVEIVSTGYQTLPRERATGSFVQVDNKTLNQQTGANILKRLDGVTSGLLFNVGKVNTNPQSSTNISIRGLSTINGPLDPLIVLDGFIYEGDINNINPNIIESVTVLKDAGAASIWGARAGNGVIVITSKKGRFNQKLKIDANVSLIISDKPNLFDLPQLSSNEIINMEEFLFNKGAFNARINAKYQALTPAIEVFLKRRSGLISATDSATQINALKQIDSRDQYQKYVYQKAIIKQYALNLSGGTSNNSYILSLGYDDSENELKNKSNKINVRLENIYQPIKDLSVRIGVTYTNSTNESGMPGYNSFMMGTRSAPYFKLADENGVPLSVASIYRDSYLDTAGVGKLLDWKFYPLEDYKHSQTTTRMNELYATAGIQYKVTSFASIDVTYQHQSQTANSANIADLESFRARDYINQFSQLNRTTGIVSYIVPMGGIKSTANVNISSHTLRGQININKAWGDHSISSILGTETRQVTGKSESFTVYGYNEDPLSNAKVDFINSYRNFITGSGQAIQGAPAFTETINRFVSAYVNSAYTYKNKYTLSGSARKDGSNIFGANTNDRWKPLWSVGAAWVISNENFYKSSVFSYLRLKTTYGFSGNVDLSRSAVPVAANFNGGPPTNLPYARIITLNNPDLRWEEIGQLNIGLEFSALKSRLSGSVEFYRKKGTDLYGETSYDYTTWGASSRIIKNVANMKGTGVDVTLRSKNIDRKIKWNTDLLFNYNKSITTAYFTDRAKFGNLTSGGNINPIIGKPLYSVVAYKWAGLDPQTGDPLGYLNNVKSKDYNGIAKELGAKGFESGNIKYIGPGSPTVFGAIINEVSWMNFSFSVNVAYKFGYYFRKSSINYEGFVSQGAGHSDYNLRWKQPGDELKTNVPSFVYPSNSSRDAFYTSSEVNVLKGDHVRLQYINLGYSFGKITNAKIPLTSFQVYLNARDLGILWKANSLGLDPDYPYAIKPVKSFTVGIRTNL